MYNLLCLGPERLGCGATSPLGGYGGMLSGKVLREDALRRIPVHSKLPIVSRTFQDG